jgi:hypothetical protein
MASAMSACSSAEKRLAKQEQKIIQENSRTVEQRKVNAMNYGDAKSKRGAEILVWDPNKHFDPNRTGVGTARQFGTGGSRTKEFNFDQKAQTGNFLTRAFGGSKANSPGEKNFATTDANAKRDFVVPGTTIKTDKAVSTKDLADGSGSKTAAVRDLPGGDRQFLGREQKKMANAVDPATLADWRSGGGETVIYNADGSVDRIGAMKRLSIDDIRELLNKNK